MKDFFRSFLNAIKLKNNWQKGIAYGAALVVVLVYLFYSFGFQSGFGVVLDIIVVVVVAGLSFFIFFWILSFLFFIFKRIPIIILSLGVGGIIILFGAQSLPQDPYLYLVIGIVTLGMVTGGLTGAFYDGSWLEFSLLKKWALSIGLITVIFFNGLFVFWIYTPGSDSHLIAVEPLILENKLLVDNPLIPGDYPFQYLVYGSGISERIPDYGEGVEITTNTVNIDYLVSMDDWKAKIRAFYWGFDLDTAPLNGQVWMPDGDGPFPLVLIVHGNHNMTDFSEGGYAYIGEHLASRGYIFVSIDQNFLNGYFTDSLSGENDARALLLLKHLGLWHDWNIDINSVFYQKVDLKNIALMGHSRGGEAAAIAAAMNQLERSPNNANNRYGFEYNIKSLIAISPSDGQYKMGGKLIEITDINYLVIQGSHDADISRFEGLRQFNRVLFTESASNLFKAAVLIDRANHSQFNTIWSPYDRKIPSRFLLNQKPLISGDQQRDTLLVYVSAFLDATLKGEDGYRAVFENYQNAGDWLPPNLYINQFQSSRFVPIANFEEDVDVLTAFNGEISAFGLLTWKELGLKFRSRKEQNNQVVEIGWGEGKQSYYSIRIEDMIDIAEFDSLSFGLVDIREFNGELLDLSIEVIDIYGNTSELKISDFGRFLPQFHVVFTKYPFWESISYKSETEPILQTFLIPFDNFMKANHNLDIGKIKVIRFNFNLSQNGKIYLDNVGIEKADS